jgi:hypothetical protein
MCTFLCDVNEGLYLKFVIRMKRSEVGSWLDFFVELLHKQIESFCNILFFSGLFLFEL